ncbi:hypothetical protein BT63DRAFT_231286 [Microthyrium microscopicum]|uniref:Voltage-gated hydrogen channel 1 n=1 Tax=Microthyrium microscopicum TaxID=703497 RepID=A0A6A6UEW8_9PEZI|nr:hypothetical protein BT63DRAFT_231286 [Microthyrium microscopicum]
MTSSSVQFHPDTENAPLLRKKSWGAPFKLDYASINLEHWYSHPFRGDGTMVSTTREKTRRLLSSKFGHYSVLTLVTLDVMGIIADFILRLFKCENAKNGQDWDTALDVLGVVSLVFSSLFMLELIASIWAFGMPYFDSWFHCLDAAVVMGGFILDILLHGTIEEAASLIVILRLWRVFKIIEELSLGAQEQSDNMERMMQQIKVDNELLRKECVHLKRTMVKAGVKADDGHNTPPNEHAG